MRYLILSDRYRNPVMEPFVEDESDSIRPKMPFDMQFYSLLTMANSYLLKKNEQLSFAISRTSQIMPSNLLSLQVNPPVCCLHSKRTAAQEQLHVEPGRRM